jgi:hypothetical protein
MPASDVDRILELVWDMDIDVNMYLSGELAPSELIQRIRETCRQIRQKAVDNTAEHELGDLERAAQELLRSPEKMSAPKRRGLPGPDESQLMKELFDLRSQLLKARGSTH